MIMKKWAAIIVLLITTQCVPAQVNINMNLAGRPPANLSEWANRKEVLTFVMSGSQSDRLMVKIKAELKTLDGTVIGATNLNAAKTYSPLPGASIVLGALDVLPLEQMIFTGKYQSTLAKTGKLPADNYVLCVQLVRLPDFAPASNLVCKNFYLAAYQLPTLMMPANEQELNANIAQSAITFRWTPVVPNAATPVTYRLQVFEVLQNQYDVQALRSNQPLLDKNIVGTTQFIWMPQLSMMPTNTTENLGADSTKKNGEGNKNVIPVKFIWTIQTLDSFGVPLNQTDGNGESRSEPIVFYVKFPQGSLNKE